MISGEMSNPKTDSHDKESPVMKRGLLKYICMLTSDTFIAKIPITKLLGKKELGEKVTEHDYYI
jgi:hypothetical protein